MSLDGTYVIGRFARSTPSRGKRSLVVPHASASDQHAELSVLLGSFYLRDLGSTNGTWRVRDGHPVAIQADYIDPEEPIYFGASAYRIADLLEHATGQRPHGQAEQRGERRQHKPRRSARSRRTSRPTEA